MAAKKTANKKKAPSSGSDPKSKRIVARAQRARLRPARHEGNTLALLGGALETGSVLRVFFTRWK
jgi:hypothetical protein